MLFPPNANPLRRLVFGFLAVTLFALFVSAKEAAADIQISGSSTIMPIVKAAGRAFFEKTGIRILVTGGGSSVGVREVLAGTSHIGMVSRTLHPDEAGRLNANTIGHDGIAIIVNSTNPMERTTSPTVNQIFSGRIDRWEKIDEFTGEIILVVKANGRSTRELFDDFFGLKGVGVPSAHVIGSNAEGIVFVAGDPWAISYVSVGTAEKARTRGVHIKLLELDGVQASTSMIKQERYPLMRPLNLVTVGAPELEERRFIDFLIGPEGQAIVEDQNFIRVTE
jgi:phosphate transport system substrate-binding protein